MKYITYTGQINIGKNKPQGIIKRTVPLESLGLEEDADLDGGNIRWFVLDTFGFHGNNYITVIVDKSEYDRLMELIVGKGEELTRF